jgi:hypothetical protein
LRAGERFANCNVRVNAVNPPADGRSLIVPLSLGGRTPENLRTTHITRLFTSLGCTLRNKTRGKPQVITSAQSYHCKNAWIGQWPAPGI